MASMPAGRFGGRVMKAPGGKANPAAVKALANAEPGL